MSDIVIVSAARTPVGSFNGALSSLPASELGKIAIMAAVERANIAMADVDEVILGQVLQGGAGQGPARQAAVKAGVPLESPAWSLNQLCGSGLRAVALGDGDADLVIEPVEIMPEVTLPSATNVAGLATTMPASFSPIKPMNSPMPPATAANRCCGITETISCRTPVSVRIRNARPERNTQPSATGQGTPICCTTVKLK